MKTLKQSQFSLQVQKSTTSYPFSDPSSEVVGLKRALPETPTASRSDLPCLNRVNSSLSINTGLEEKEEKPSSAQIRTSRGLEENIKAWETMFGLDRMGFLTVTCKENIRCKKEYARRWKRFNNHLQACGIEKVLVKVDEPQKRGAWHSHAIVLLSSDIRTGFNWEHYKHARQIDQIIYKQGGYKNAPKQLRDFHSQSTARYASSANPLLRSVWHRIRKASKKSGFGRCEVMPIQHSKACGQYASKYLKKGFSVKTPETYRMRKINYCRGVARRVASQFRWAMGKSQEWRKNLGAFARYHGIREGDFTEMARKFGKKWAYFHGDEIMHVGERERWIERQHLTGYEAIEARSDWDWMTACGSPVP